MLTSAEQKNLVRQGFEDLAAEGQEWVELPEVARRAMMRHPKFMRKRRAANRIRGLVGRHKSDEPKRVPFQYRHQTSIVASDLEANGEIEHRFVDSDGRLRKNPVGPRDFRDRRYRLLAEAGADGEASVEARFEGIAERIRALPGAVAKTDEQNQEIATQVSSIFDGDKGGTRSLLRLDLEVLYLPGREGASEAEPYSILASWDTPQSEKDDETYEYLSVDKLNGNGQETSRSLDVLEDSVRAVELTRTLTHAEEEIRQIYSRSFAPRPIPAEISASPYSEEPFTM